MRLFPSGNKVALALLSLLLCKILPLAHSQPVEQSAVEAAMTLQVLNFTEWPEKQEPRPADAPRKIGVFDSPESLAAFQSLLANPLFKDQYTVELVTIDTPQETLYSLDAIFFSQAEPAQIPRIIRKLENMPVVLVGAFDGFLEQGGLVNLTRRQRRLGFEIQMDNSKRRGIEYRAKLLRLATRIVQE